jgi:hypothetical protein
MKQSNRGNEPSGIPEVAERQNSLVMDIRLEI